MAYVADAPTENEEELQKQKELLRQQLEKFEERAQSLEDAVAYLDQKWGKR